MRFPAFNSDGSFSTVEVQWKKHLMFRASDEHVSLVPLSLQLDVGSMKEPPFEEEVPDDELELVQIREAVL